MDFHKMARGQTDVENSEAKPTAKKAELVLSMAVLCAAFLPWAIGASYDKTGEQVGSGVPFPTLVLLAATVVLVIIRRRIDWPVPRCTHLLFLSAVSLGLLGLSRPELKSGIKELIQIAEVFVICWYVFVTLPKEHRPVLFRGIAYLGVMSAALLPLARYKCPTFILSPTHLGIVAVITLPFVIRHLKGVLQTATILFVSVGLGLFLKNGGILLVWCLICGVSLVGLERRVIFTGLAGLVMALGISFVSPGKSAWNSLCPSYDSVYRKRIFIECEAALLAPKQYPFGGGLGEYKRTINRLKLGVEHEPSPSENKIMADSNSQYLLTMVEAGMPAALTLAIFLGGLAILAFRRGEDCGRTVALALAGLCLSGAFGTFLGKGIGIWTGAVLGLGSACAPALIPRARSLLLRFAVPGVVGTLCLAVLWSANKTVDQLEHVSASNMLIRTMLFDQAGREEPLRPDTPSGVNQIGQTETGVAIISLGNDDDDDEGVSIRIEGESFTSVTAPLIKSKANEASGNEVLEIPAKSGKAKGQAVYFADISEAGKYKLRARVFWQDGCSNSLRFLHRNNPIKVTSGLFERWHDLEGKRTWNLPAGRAKIVVQNVEDGVRLDYFILEKADQD